MSYGGTRPWALWKQMYARSTSLELYGTGYLYKTKEAAERGLERLIEKGELRRDSDGYPYTVGLGLRVEIAEIPR